MIFFVVGCDAGSQDSKFVDVSFDWGIDLITTTGTSNKNHILESITGGVALFDYDNDKDLDIYLVNGMNYTLCDSVECPRSTLYRNDGDSQFTDVGIEAGVAHRGWGMGCAVVDYNSDGWKDLYITAYGPNVLYENNGSGKFTDVSKTSGIAYEGWSTGAAFDDFDGDGDIDLYLANYIVLDSLLNPSQEHRCRWLGIEVFCGPRGLQAENDRYYRNEGREAGWTFSDATEISGLANRPYFGLGVVAGDWDGDGDRDLYVANDAGANVLWDNEGGYFTSKGAAASAVLSQDGREQSGMGIAVGDYDANGAWDLFVTNFSHDNNTLYQNQGHGYFFDVSFISGIGQSSLSMLGWGNGFFDYDNDGDDDLFVANGHVYPQVDLHDLGTRYKQYNQLFENIGDGALIEVSTIAGKGLQIQESSRGSAFGDLDNDGDIDIVTWNMDTTPTVLRNDLGNTNHWLMVKLTGLEGNSQAIGGQVSVYREGQRQMRQVRSGTGYLSQDDTRLHFGLGNRTKADSVVVRWPDASYQVLTDVVGDRVITIKKN